MSRTHDFVPQTQRHHSTRIVVMPLILIALSTVTGPLHAEEDIERLHSDPLSVSIATGNKKPLNLAPAVASVFTAQDIESVGARNLTEILAMVPGFHIGYSFDRYKPLYAVRGFSSANNQGVLVMIDGVPQTELLFGDRQHVIGTLPMTSIERVEVMRGPGSALYGADAYTAVVNVITKKQAPNTTSATVSSGTYDTRAAELLSGGTTGGVTSSASVSYSRSDGHEPVIAKDQQTNFDRLFRTNASLAPGRASTEREEIGGLANLSWGDSTVSLRTFKSDYGMGIGLASTLDPFGSVITTGVQTGYNYAKSLNQNLAFSAVINYSYLDYEMNNVHFFPPGAFRVFSDGVIFNEEHIERVIYSRIATEYTALDAHVLSSGIGGEIATLQQIQ